MPPRSTTHASALEPVDASELKGSKQTDVLFEADADTIDGSLAVDITQFKKAEKRKLILVWRNILLFGYLHVAALYGGYLFFVKALWATVFFSIFLYSIGVLGITAGAHRLWAHRSYKAKWPLRLILIAFNTVAFQD